MNSSPKCQSILKPIPTQGSPTQIQTPPRQSPTPTQIQTQLTNSCSNHLPDSFVNKTTSMLNKENAPFRSSTTCYLLTNKFGYVLVDHHTHDETRERYHSCRASGDSLTCGVLLSCWHTQDTPQFKNKTASIRSEWPFSYLNCGGQTRECNILCFTKLYFHSTGARMAGKDTHRPPIALSLDATLSLVLAFYYHTKP